MRKAIGFTLMLFAAMAVQARATGLTSEELALIAGKAVEPTELEFRLVSEEKMGLALDPARPAAPNLSGLSAMDYSLPNSTPRELLVRIPVLPGLEMVFSAPQ